MLTKFETQRGATTINARDLDRNFEQLQPVSNGTYGINQGDNGWSLDILPAYPQSATQALYLTYTGGSLQWRTIEQNDGAAPGAISPGAISPGSLPGSAISPGTLLPSAMSPGPNGSLFITENNTAKWSSAPPAGTAGWREVERCDGKTMYVWGTEWAD